MKKTKVCIELNLPGTVDPLRLADLRALHKEIRNAQGCDVELTFVIRDETERRYVDSFCGMVWVNQYAKHIDRQPREYGACENFRFIMAERRQAERRL